MLASLISTPEELKPLLVHSEASSQPVFVVYYASWCPDCTNAEAALDTTFGAESGRRAVQVIVGERNTWKAPNNVFRQAPYNISNIPTVVRYDGGKETARIVEGNILDSGKLSDFVLSA